MNRKKVYIWIAAVVAVTAIVLFLIPLKNSSPEPDPEEEVVELLYGIPYKGYNLEHGTVENGQTLSTILARYGIGATQVDRIARAVEPSFSLRNIRAGHDFTVFLLPDTISRMAHFVYEISLTQYIVISPEADTVRVRMDEKEVRIERCVSEATITSSLWNCMMANDLSPVLAMDLSDIYAWSVDFFALQPGDNFKVIYEQKYVDTLNIGVGRIWGATFEHGGKTYYAIPFEQGGKITYWDENGNSLRKNFLKAPLKFSRISSRFSGSRLHPVLKIRRPHHGVDYAAPSGTPVHAVADGTVTSAGYAGGGGNTVKIKHTNGFSSAYLHLRGYAKGIRAGVRVAQGDLIGYVGSTGLSTGPHLDFRLWHGNQAIDPLKAPSEPAEPISEANRADFAIIKERILGELAGTLPDSLKVTQLDSIR